MLTKISNQEIRREQDFLIFIYNEKTFYAERICISRISEISFCDIRREILVVPREACALCS